MNETEDKPVSRSEHLSALWVEYRYRHDLVWRILVTSAVLVTTLSIIPYTSIEVARAFGRLILLAPVCSAIAVVLSALVLRREVELMELVNKKYNECRKEYLGVEHKPHNGESRFPRAVSLLLILGLIVSAGNWLLINDVWLPHLERGAS